MRDHLTTNDNKKTRRKTRRIRVLTLSNPKEKKRKIWSFNQEWRKSSFKGFFSSKRGSIRMRART